MQFTTNIFTCCNKHYKDFIPIFILSHLYFNESCFVEIGVDDLDYLPIQNSLEILQKYYNYDNDSYQTNYISSFESVD